MVAFKTASEISKVLSRGSKHQRRAVLFDRLDDNKAAAAKAKGKGFTGLDDPDLQALAENVRFALLERNFLAALGAISLIIKGIKTANSNEQRSDS